MTAARAPFGLRRMIARDRTEPHRSASSLELLFDLVFAVAVAQASDTLHGTLAEGHVGRAVLGYLMVFFAIWWAWMNFSWFASSFDTDDWAYRVVTVVQMAGALVLAAGVHAALTDYDFRVVTWGYVIMRLAMVGQWVRAGVSDAASRRTAFTFAVGVVIVQVLWVARLAIPSSAWQMVTFFVLVVAEIAVPLVAERQGGTAWHAEHIVDRYGSFTLILLGESVLASAIAVFQTLQQHGARVVPLAGLAAAGLVIAAGMWWAYFSRDQAPRLVSTGNALMFGYTHYVIFAAAGAVSAGIQTAIDLQVHETALSRPVAALVLTVPVAVFALATWILLLRPLVSRVASVAIVALSAIVLASSAVPAASVAVVAAAVAAGVVVLEVDAARRR